jgi:hypothetical protein
VSWLLPWSLGAAVAAAIGVALLHLLARDRPPRWMLPTARFVAPGTARATRRARTPRDLPLLLARMLALLLAGAAFAAPVLHPEGGTVAQVLVLDLGDARSAAAAADTARARLVDGDRLVLVDTAVRIVAAGAERAMLDSLAANARSRDSRAGNARTPDSLGAAPTARTTLAGAVRPSLTALLIAGVRAAALLPQQADSAELVMIAPTAAHDAALAQARATWPGRVTVVDVAREAASGAVVQIGGAADSTAAIQRPAVRGAAGDAIVAAARMAGASLLPAGSRPAASGTLVVRDLATAVDSAWVRDGGTLVVWPADAVPAGRVALARPDTLGGIVADGRVALFAAVRSHTPPPGAVMARWIDGEPAVSQQALGQGCIRTAAVDVPAAGDITLRPAFQAVLQALMRPCALAQPAPIADSTRALLVGEGALARAGALRASSSRSPATPWLLGAALALLLVAEPVLRRTRNRGDAGAPA